MLTPDATTAIWFVVAMLSFMLLDSCSLSLGDDFGYMFTDSAHHSCDGERVVSFKDCLTTQASHYTTTNGRFLVHVVDMAMLNLVPEWIYRLINAFMFGCVWLWVFLLGFRKNRDCLTACGVLVCLWLLIPKAGVVMLSLYSYSINYTWTAAATLTLLYLIYSGVYGKLSRPAFVATALLTVAVGSLQESFGVPLAVAFASELIFSWKGCSCRLRTVFIMYMIGVAVCVASPGNIHHFLQGGGFSSGGMVNKFVSFGRALLISPMPYLLLGVLTMLIINRNECTRFLRRNRLLFVAVVSSLLFASFTFTSARQLYAPSVFSIILICRFVDGRLRLSAAVKRAAVVCCAVVILPCYACVWFLRWKVSDNQHRFVAEFEASPSSIACGDAARSPYNTHPLLWTIFGAFSPDPWEGSQFSMPFDSYSRKGLSRIAVSADNPLYISALLPYSREYIIKHCKIENPGKWEYEPIPLDRRYGVVAVRSARPRAVSTNGPVGTRCEMFTTEDGVCVIVVPSEVTAVGLRY